MQRIFIMASNHVSLPHNPSSSNTNKNHGSFPLYSWLHLFFFFFNSNFSLLSIHSPSFSFISLSTIHLFTYCNLISFNMLYNNINKFFFRMYKWKTTGIILYLFNHIFINWKENKKSHWVMMYFNKYITLFDKFLQV
jgi:hypothetical protein